MSAQKVQFLGYAYEGAFKLGFLRKLLPQKEYESFKAGSVFGFLRGLPGVEAMEGFQRALNTLEKIVPDHLDDFTTERRFSGENLLMFLFLVGYYEGLYYGTSFRNVSLIRYHLGNETDLAGVYWNADLMFIADNVLHVIDFKLAGAHRQAVSILEGGSKPRIPFRVAGLPVNISLGEFSFQRFVKRLLDIEDKLYDLEEVSPELKGFVQVVSYAVDYLCEERRRGELTSISEVSLSLLYPLAEPFVARFYYGGEELLDYRERVRELYRKVRDKEWSFSELEVSTETRWERLGKEMEKKLKELREKMEERETEVVTLKPGSIHIARDDVRDAIQNFVAQEHSPKVLCLLHSAGSGKTTTTREAILHLPGSHIVLYFATRKVLLDREYAVLQNKPNVKLIYERRLPASTQGYVKNVGDAYQKDRGATLGILRRTINRIREEFGGNGEEKNIIWALATQQALTETPHGTTIDHLNKLLSPRIVEQAHIHIIMDEFLGHNNGLPVIMNLMEFLKKLHAKGGKGSLYLFDANGYSTSLFKKLLEEYGLFQVMPEALVVCDYAEREVFDVGGIRVEVRAKHGYPAPEIRIRKKFFELPRQKTKEKFYESVISYVKQTFTDKEGRTAFLFLQDKARLIHLMEGFRREGYSCLLATADSRRSQEQINKGTEDIILATSTLSRGVDLSRPKKPVSKIYMIVQEWGIEKNLVELLQAISRARGDEKTESEPKELHFLYLITPVRRNQIEGIEYYLDGKVLDKALLRKMLKKQSLEQILELDEVISLIVKRFLGGAQQGPMLVPIPSQFGATYVPNHLTDLESLLGFLENVALLEKDQKVRKKIRVLLRKLVNATYVYVVNIDLNNQPSYYHPYLLFEKQPVRIGFSNEQRESIQRLFKGVKNFLERHNPEKAELLGSIINTALPMALKSMPTLVPVYSWVLTRHFLGERDKVTFEIDKRMGRGGVRPILGTHRPLTHCARTTAETEYACIPLGEDYPYKEVLSGKFAKYPIEFVKRLMEESYE
jgi:hypothetical protein